MRRVHVGEYILNNVSTWNFRPERPLPYDEITKASSMNMLIQNYRSRINLTREMRVSYYHHRRHRQPFTCLLSTVTTNSLVVLQNAL